MSNGYDELSERALGAAAKPVAESVLLPQRRFRDTVSPPMGEATSDDLPPWLMSRKQKGKKVQKEGPGYAYSDWESEDCCEPPEITVKVTIPLNPAS